LEAVSIRGAFGGRTDSLRRPPPRPSPQAGEGVKGARIRERALRAPHRIEDTVLSDDRDVESLFTAPPLSCDAHFHVFGPLDRYPHGGVNEKLRYAPPLAPLEDYLVQARRLGFERFVFVQPSAYGRDNAYMLDAMARLPGSRGIVDVDQDAPDGMLAALHSAGVRGVRINVSPVKPPEAGFAAGLLPRIVRLDACCAEIGWHLDFLLPGWLTQELIGTLHRLRAPFSLAHMGMFRAADGVGQPGFANSSISCAMARDGPG
jgi:2-pyrone-4,6-dicarboxylate lactonase